MAKMFMRLSLVLGIASLMASCWLAPEPAEIAKVECDRYDLVNLKEARVGGFEFSHDELDSALRLAFEHACLKTSDDFSRDGDVVSSSDLKDAAYTLVLSVDIAQVSTEESGFIKDKSQHELTVSSTASLTHSDSPATYTSTHSTKMVKNAKRIADIGSGSDIDNSELIAVLVGTVSKSIKSSISSYNQHK